MSVRTNSLIVVFAAASAFGCNIASAQRSGGLMDESQKIERIVTHLAASDRTPKAVARALGSSVAGQQDRYEVQIGAGLFQSAKVWSFQDDVNVDFTLSPGDWRLADITDDAGAWKSSPLLPDTGVLELFREWEWQHIVITCTARMKGHRSAADELVQSVSCQISPP